MKLKLDFNSLMFKNWLYIMSFSVLILALLWVLQVFFLRTYYTGMKTKEIVKIGNNIVRSYGTAEFMDKLSEYAFNDNINIIIYDERDGVSITVNAFNAYDSPQNDLPQGDPVQNDSPQNDPPQNDPPQGDLPQNDPPQGDLPQGDPFRSAGNPMRDAFRFPHDELLELKKRLADSGATYAHFTRGGGDRGVLVFGAMLTEAPDPPRYLLINSPMAPIGSTAAVLQNQLGMITVILFLLSIVMAQLISRKLSIPIIKLTKSAQELATGNIDVTFSGGGFTEIHQLASTLNYATNELSKLEKYRKDFIANVSHDLKTPLTIIKFYAEMIMDVSGGNPAKREAHCGLIVKETDRLTGLVNELLDLSKLQSGNETPEMAVFDLGNCLADVLDGFHVLCDKEGFVFDERVEEAVTVRADEQMIRRVIYNLVSNAVNHTGEDRAVTVKLYGTNGRAARFEVIDTGAGIPQEDLGNIWERYYKSPETHTRSVVGTGTGLGLPIVKSILTAHGAPFGVESEPGSGSTFWFELPLLSHICTSGLMQA